MALIKMGSLAVQISGSVGGLTYARNRGGQYVRARISPVNPASPRQSEVRQVFAALSNYWSTVLTDVQRAGWDQYASQVPLTNSLGESTTVSGINMFQRANTLLLDTGNPQRDDAPDSFTQGPSFTPTLNVSAASDLIAVNDFGSFTPGSPDIGFLVQQGQTQNPGVNFFRGPFRKVYGVPVTVASPSLPVININAAFPFSVGQVVFLRAIAVTLDGRVGVPSIQRFLAA